MPFRPLGVSIRRMVRITCRRPKAGPVPLPPNILPVESFMAVICHLVCSCCTYLVTCLDLCLRSVADSWEPEVGDRGNVCPARARRAPGALLLY